jgi:DNA repair protein SbcC/Rad50
MLVRRLALRNFRSYSGDEETTLDFPEGVVLIEGDIGSGKSSLLYALEFALFGFSDLKGSHLLNEGRNDGRVSVTFETDGTEYTIERSLKVKGRDVVQDECRISTSGEWERLSPSDLKERVVSILGFNEPTHPRAESLVYRYAVFTPQEQMKQILIQDSEERLQVIRRVLGAQSYQVAAENSETVGKKVREAALGRRKVAEDLEEKKDELEELSAAAARLKADIPELEQRGEAAARLVRTLDARWRESLRDREELGRAEARIPRLEEDIADLREEMADDEERIAGLESQLANEIEPIIKRFEARTRPPLGSKEAETALNQARETLTRLRDSARALEEDIEKTRDLIKKGVCPLCGQKISGDFHAKTEHSGQELSKLREQISSSEGEVDRLTGGLESIKAFEEEEKESQRASQDVAKLEKELSSRRKKLQQDNMKLSRALSELKEATAKVKETGALSRDIAELESRLNSARSDEKVAAQELTKAKTELADSSRELERLAAEVKKKEASLQESRRLTTYQNWLAEYFRPTVELIEKQTLSQAAARFNEHFQRFFTSLVDDPDMIVRVKEDFSPVFEREGFEQDFEALSGGERTSMALAYRFALNSVVKETVSSRPDLMILDEPTDGFSKEQIFKMRGLLDELDSRQVILVSHEKELESMADHIFRVEKRNGSSLVSRVGA